MSHRGDYVDRMFGIEIRRLDLEKISSPLVGDHFEATFEGGPGQQFGDSKDTY